MLRKLKKIKKTYNEGKEILRRLRKLLKVKKTYLVKKTYEG